MSVPDQSVIPFEFSYQPSKTSPSTNLLIFLHGLGDTHFRFHKLGRDLNLPQTATLALCAPLPIPFIEAGSQWYPSFDRLGEILSNPNPSIALEQLSRTIKHLIHDVGWAPNRIHLFGFGQGGSLACELARRVYYDSTGSPPHHLGSVVTVCGPLLTYATSTSNRCPTPVLIFYRPDAEDDGGLRVS